MENNWEEFDKRFEHTRRWLEIEGEEKLLEELKAFISSLLQEQRQRMAKEIIKEIPDKVRLPDFDEYMKDGRAESEWTADYNVAAGRNNLIDTLKQQLRAKYLGEGEKHD